MALIKCIECGGKISSEAISCPHCGYPTNKINETKTIKFKNKVFVVDNIVEELKNGHQAEAYCDIVEEICCQIHDDDPNDADDIMYLICQKYKIRNVNLVTRNGKFNDAPKCPTCGSTDLFKKSAAGRALDGFVFGRLSVEGRAQWQCKNCGYMW